jgi:hypothetical protein
MPFGSKANRSAYVLPHRGQIRPVACIAFGLLVLLLGLLFVTVSFLVSYDSVRNQLLQSYGEERTSHYFSPMVFFSALSRIRLIAGLLLVLGVAIVRFRDRLARLLDSFWRLLSSSFSHERRWRTQCDRVSLIGLNIITLVGLGIRLRFIDQPIRYDESATILGYASKPLFLGLSIYNQPNNHLFHTLLVHIAIKLAGSAEWVARLPALIAGVLLCPLAYALSRRFSSTFSALLTAAFVSTSSILIEYSTNARGYTLICCATLALTIAGYETFRRASAWWFFLFGLIAVIGFWTIPIFLIPFGGVFLWMATESLGHPRRFQFVYRTRLIITCLLAGVATICVYLPPVTVNGFKALSNNQWVAPRDFETFLLGNATQFHLTWILWNRDLPWWWFWIVTIAFFGGIALFPRIRRLVFCLALWTLLLFAVRRFVPFSRTWLLFLPIVFMAASSTFGWMVTRITALSQDAYFGAVAATIVTTIFAIPVLQNRSVLSSPETGVLRSAPQIAELMISKGIRPDHLFLDEHSGLILEYYWWRRFGIRPTFVSRKDLVRNGESQAWVLLNDVDGEKLAQFSAFNGFDNVAVLEKDSFDGASLYHVSWGDNLQ